MDYRPDFCAFPFRGLAFLASMNVFILLRPKLLSTREPRRNRSTTVVCLFPYRSLVSTLQSSGARDWIARQMGEWTLSGAMTRWITGSLVGSRAARGTGSRDPPLSRASRMASGPRMIRGFVKVCYLARRELCVDCDRASQGTQVLKIYRLLSELLCAEYGAS